MLPVFDQSLTFLRFVRIITCHTRLNSSQETRKEIKDGGSTAEMSAYNKQRDQQLN